MHIFGLNLTLITLQSNMNLQKIIFLFSIAIFFNSCSNNHKINNNVDTVQVISEIFSPNSAIIKNFNHKSLDTFYILKSKKYHNQSWPKSVKKLTLLYIDDNSKNSSYNKPGSGKIDARKRFGLTKFELNNDSAFVDFTYFNSPTGFTFKLVKKGGKWLLIDVNYILFNPVNQLGK